MVVSPCVFSPSVHSVLCLGAHSDDIEIGCGGTVLRLLSECPDLHFTWIVFGAAGERAAEARKCADAFLGQAKSKRILVKDFRDGYFPYIGVQIKDFFEELHSEVNPDLILTHYRHDLHQDHRLISELTWNTFRSNLILEYEVPKYDGDLGTPNLFVTLPRAVCDAKVAQILAHFESQRGKSWFDEEVFFSLLRLRGIECNTPIKYAEAFYCRKMVL
jgi:LmbE family N-acetylglucosaminyl deacetylase